MNGGASFRGATSPLTAVTIVAQLSRDSCSVLKQA
jgi:hypothetical protein